MKKLLMAATLAAAMAGPAAAQVYVGAGAGSARTDTNETSWKLYGGYQFSPVWGLEVGYNDLGKFRGANMDNWTLAVTGTLPLAERWTLLGKVGAAYNHSHLGNTDNHTDVLLGLGVGYSFNKTLGARLEYENFGKLSDNSGSSNTGRSLGLSLKYLF